jgi:hypothetical protein
MAKPNLPTRPADTWGCEFVFDTARDVRAVSARGGLVLAGGDALYMARPGAVGLQTRPLPDDVGPVVAVAAEPRPPFRLAIATEELVVLFVRGAGGDQLVRLRGPDRPTHLAWARVADVFSLYICWGDGAVVRSRRDMTGVEVIEVPPVQALAADNAGTLALLSAGGPDACVYVSRDGATFDVRALDIEEEPDRHVHLAVAGGAVAYSLAGDRVAVSRAKDKPFEPCAALAEAGAIDFQGPGEDAPLLGVRKEAGYVSIVRVDGAGAAMRVADFGSDDAPAPDITDIAWDASRRLVWGASPQMGLVRCTEPGAKKGKGAAS